MDNKFDNNAKIFKALSDTNRLQIIEILSCGEKCACRLLEHFNFTQPTLSHHMKVLMECGLVNSRKEGTWNYYSLNIENTNELRRFLDELISFKDSSMIDNTSECEC
ncbi:metalloregulator ArsR/SmtB family transcription factor [Clostridioides difficile]